MTKWVVVQCHNGEFSCSEPYDYEEDALSEMTMFFVEREFAEKKKCPIVEEEVSDDESYMRFSTETCNYMLRVFEIDGDDWFVVDHVNGFIGGSVMQFDNLDDASNAIRDKVLELTECEGYRGGEHDDFYSKVFIDDFEMCFHIFLRSDDWFDVLWS